LSFCRVISNYADWDVLARMPHGIQSIQKHLQTVDNVPLLVSLYTDSTYVFCFTVIRALFLI
jgi:hypothetical protein